ncbi:Actin-like protein 6A [Trichinella britovi]|uniref:Actin-like protein 6A n=1 Tax=Trichinella britovi TaxID=45882 RepID=A0A0V1D4F5_TRIBR|nr:Actin-like protein 6A [Trichinella britovi]
MKYFFNLDPLPIIFDAGHHSLRIGLSGRKKPEIDMYHWYGCKDYPMSPQLPSADLPEKPVRRNARLKLPFKVPITIDDDEDIPLTVASQRRELFFGSDALDNTNHSLGMYSFLENGIIQDYDFFEAVMYHLYALPGFGDSCEHNVFFTEPPWNKNEHRKRIAEMMFETFDVPSIYFYKNAALAAFANGRTTGLVVDCGATHTSVVPVREGYCLQKGLVTSPFGGDAMSALCAELMEKRQIKVVPPKEEVDKPFISKDFVEGLHSFAHWKNVENFKRNVVAIRGGEQPWCDVENAEEVDFDFLGSGKHSFGIERFQLGENMFSFPVSGATSALAIRTGGIWGSLKTSVGKIPIEWRQSLSNAIIITGGNSSIQGLDDRLVHEVNSKKLRSTKLKVCIPPPQFCRSYSAFVGASLITRLDVMENLWLRRRDYEEFGVLALMSKCP